MVIDILREMNLGRLGGRRESRREMNDGMGG